MKKNKIKILVKILFFLLILTLCFYIIKTIVDCINIYSDLTTSFPWYTPILFNSVLFVIPILLESVLLIYFYLRSKK